MLFCPFFYATADYMRATAKIDHATTNSRGLANRPILQQRPKKALIVNLWETSGFVHITPLTNARISFAR